MNILLDGIQDTLRSSSDQLIKDGAVVDQTHAAVAKNALLNPATSPLTIPVFLDVLRRYGTDFDLLFGCKVVFSGTLVADRVQSLLEAMTAVFINDEKFGDPVVSMGAQFIASVVSSIKSCTVLSIADLICRLWPSLRFVFALVSALHPAKLVHLPYLVRYYLNFAFDSPLIHTE